jgi:ABC-type oligopeptide transport system substrate-binding subunit
MIRRYIRRFFIVSLISLWSFFVFSYTTLVALDTAVTLVSSTENVHTSHGLPFEIDVTLDTPRPVAGFQMRLLYDANLFELINLDFDQRQFPGLIYNIETPGVISVAFSQTVHTITGFNSLFQLSFMVKSFIPYGQYDVISLDQTFTNEIVMMGSNSQITAIPAVSYVFNDVHVGVFGDLNMDGKVTIQDALMIQLHLAGKTLLLDTLIELADINRDGQISLMDVAILQLYIVGKIDVIGPNMTGDIPIEFFQKANGIYDFSELNYTEIAKIYAAAENYLLENVYAGVPLFTGATRTMFSSRVELFSPSYNGVLGFGLPFSKLNADDSNVIMSGNTYGNANEFTLRIAYAQDPETLNSWTNDISSIDQLIEQFNGTLYDYFFDDTKTGFNIQPSLAESDPIPVNPTVINGQTYAKVWQIPVKNNLTWKYHPNTDLSGLTSGHEVLNAEDFLWTYRYALQQQWFRARTGGSDFVTNQIKGAAEFLAGSIGINDVGLRLASGKQNTLEIEYTQDKSLFDVKYQFASPTLSPVNQQLLQKLTPQVYASSPETTPSSGVYYLDSWIIGETLSYKKNPNHPLKEMYHYTGIQYKYMTGVELIFQALLDGKIDVSSIPVGRTLEYASDSRVKTIPSATIYRLVINGFGTEQRRDEYIESHPDVPINPNFIPEPILMYKEMRQALYYGFDRYDAAVNQAKIYLPAYTLLSSTYLIDIAHGISIRTLPAGADILIKYGYDNDGFVPNKAVSLFEQAVNQAIAEGYYEPGNASDYTVIELDLTYSSNGIQALQTMAQQLKLQYESRLVDHNNHVRLQINLLDVAFPSSYYDYMQKANTDLGIAGISGTIPRPEQGFLSYYTDDNRSGFTLDYGIDTTTANIPLAYRNASGQMVYELWSYNAIVSALNGKVFVKDGIEQTIWSSPENLITAQLSLNDDVLATMTEDTLGIATLLIGDLNALAIELNVDSIESYVVTTASGQDLLYILKQTPSGYRLYHKISLVKTAREAIIVDNGFYNLTSVSEQPLTLQEINAIPYIFTTYDGGFTSMNEIWTEAKVPAGMTAFVYSTKFNNAPMDAYVVLKIGDYYIGWYWL